MSKKILNNMKRINLLSFCFILLFMSSACSNKVTVKGKDGTEYESYQECCAAQDFQAAHQFLAKMKKARESTYDAEEFVFKREALYLMSIGDEASKKRIIYLLKEEEDKSDRNNHIDMLIDLAIDNNDEDFVKVLANQYEGKMEYKTIQKMVDFFVKRDTDDNKNYLISLIKNRIEVDDTDCIALLASLKDVSVSDAIVEILLKISVSGHPLPKGLRQDVNSDHLEYVKGVISYNNDCDRFLNIAIGGGNQYLAQKVLICFKQNIETIYGNYSGIKAPKAPDGTRVEYHNYYIYYTNNDKNEAQKKYQEAVRSGAFK